jgi:hypothetical protein
MYSLPELASRLLTYSLQTDDSTKGSIRESLIKKYKKLNGVGGHVGPGVGAEPPVGLSRLVGSHALAGWIGSHAYAG